MFNGVADNDDVETKKKAAGEFYKFGDNNIGTNSNTDDQDVMTNINELLADHNENEELAYEAEENTNAGYV